MNKYKDALTYLRSSALVTDHKQKEKVNQCTDVLQELVDKETPMQVEKVISDSDITIGKITIRKGTTVIQKCPKCGGIIMKVHNKNYCGNCGQAICWGEEDE